MYIHRRCNDKMPWGIVHTCIHLKRANDMAFGLLGSLSLRMISIQCISYQFTKVHRIGESG